MGKGPLGRCVSVPRMVTTPAHYLVKSEPYKYPFAQLCRDGQTRWDGVRSFEARNNLRAMRVGDLLLFYHSNEGKEIVGVAQVVTAAYPDPTAPGEDWSVVDIAPVVALSQPVTLGTIKAEPRLADINLVRKSRVSVVPITATEFALLLRMSGTKLPATAGQPAKTAGSLPLPAQAIKPQPAKKRAAKKRATKTAAAKPRPAKAGAPRATKAAAAKSRPSAAPKSRPAKNAAAKSPSAKNAETLARPLESTRARRAAP
jgi:predicted RNA-binding protein with PUA-like domain